MGGWDYVSVSVVCRIYVYIMNDVLSGTTNVTMYLYVRNHKLFTIMGSDPFILRVLAVSKPQQHYRSRRIELDEFSVRIIVCR